MFIQKFQPSDSLAKLIKCYYYLERSANEIIHDTYFADGCIEAVFSVGWEFYKENDPEPWAKIIGQIIKPRSLKIVGGGRSFGIWFYPHAFSRFTNVQMFELNDRVLPWDEIFPKSFADFVGDCLYAGQLNKLVNGSDRFFMERMSTHHVQSMHKLTAGAVHYLYQKKSAADLDHLASSFNVSHRYLQKAFLTKIGFSQKLFLRMLRFQDILQRMDQTETENLTELACAHNYYDQSHFVRDFKSFTGIAPSRFETKNFPINQHFIISNE